MSDLEHPVDITNMDYIRDLEKRAQAAAEQRIEIAHASLDEDVDDSELCAPFCGCLTCEVREILDAAWPFLQRLAASTCWCGGHRGPRDLPDADGWGCLEDIHHRGER